MNTIKSILSLSLFISLILGFCSCDNFVYEEMNSCSPKVQFSFKKHRQSLHQIPGKETDAFSSTVGSVHLFVFDSETGNLVFEKIEKTDNLVSASQINMGSNTDRCYMPLDIKPGKYRIVAWCGLDDNDTNNAFYLNNSTRGGYAQCNVKLTDKGNPVHSEKYEGLYHGVVHEVEVKPEGDRGMIIPVELTKNTNDIAVWVQHASQTFKEGDYEVVYTDTNGTMHFEDNSISQKDKLEYLPHTSSILTSSTEYNGSVMETGALIAHISTSRLMAAHKNDARLEVRNKEGKTVFSIPFIKYVTNLQTFTNDEQHYLDCEDTYNCSFYLTGGNEDGGIWTPAQIIINNWVVVPDQNNEL